MHFSTAEEGSDWFPSWRKPLMPISSQGFSQRGVSIRENLDLRARWSPSGSQYLRRGYDIWRSSGDFLWKRDASENTISSFFLGIVSGHFDMWEKKRKKCITVIHRRGISMILESGIFRNYPGIHAPFLPGHLQFFHRSIRKISGNSMRFRRTQRM